MYNDKYIEKMVSMLGLLSPINLIIEKIYLNNDDDIENLCRNLRKRILDWFEESTTKPEIQTDE